MILVEVEVLEPGKKEPHLFHQTQHTQFQVGAAGAADGNGGESFIGPPGSKTVSSPGGGGGGVPGILMDLVVDLVEEQVETDQVLVVEPVLMLLQQNQDQHPLHQMDMEMVVVPLLLVRVVEAAVVPVVLVKMDNLLVLMVDLD